MKSHSLPIIGILLVTACALQAASVKTVQPAKTTLKRTTAQPATLLPYHQTEIHPKVEGYMGEISVDIGDMVKSGQQIAGIAVPEMKYLLEAQLGKVDQIQYKRQQLAAEVNGIEAEYKALESENNRIQELLKTKSVTQKIGDEVASRFEAVKARLKSAKIQVSSADAERRQAEARKEEIKVLMGYAVLKAPFDGVVTQRSVSPDDYVAPGGRTPLFTISQVNPLRLHVPVPEKDAIWITKGDKASIAFPALAKPVEAAVTRTSGSLDPKTRTLTVEIEINNADGKLLPGMFGMATITMQEKSAIVVPSGTIRFNADGSEKLVYVVKADNTITHVPVELGIDTGNEIEVISGLTGNERIVTGMLGTLKEGESVTVLKN